MEYYEGIGVLTYVGRHRKTYDTLCLLKANGYHNVTVYAKPFHYQKKFQPIIEHRPKMNFDISTDTVCRNFKYKYFEINEYEAIDALKGSIMLVCGAGILPDSFVERYQVINAHPGYIPNARGLDALKWAIVEREPVGVTTHLIGREIDAGRVICREEIPIYENDTFHALAWRVYEKEISMLVDAVAWVQGCGEYNYIAGGSYVVHKRMSQEVDRKLLDLFEEYKKDHKTRWNSGA